MAAVSGSSVKLLQAKGAEDLRALAFDAYIVHAPDVGIEGSRQHDDGDAILLSRRVQQNGLAVDLRSSGIVEISLKDGGLAPNTGDCFGNSLDLLDRKST